MTEAIVVSEAYRKLEEEYLSLKVRLSQLALDHDELVFVQCKNLEMIYMLELGSLDYQLLELSIELRRSRRKLELMQARINRQEEIDLKLIETILDGELKAYEKRLEELLGQMVWAEARSQSAVLSPEDKDKLKELYRKILFLIHPDLHGKLDAREKNLFNQAVRAYKEGDLERMEILFLQLEVLGDFIPELDGAKTLQVEIERLKELIAGLEEKMDQVKQAYPYNKKDLLSSKEKLEEARQALRLSIQFQEETLLIYQSKIRDILEGKDGKYH